MLLDHSNITLSIISHLQQHLVKELLDDLEKYADNDIKVILTLNVPELLDFNTKSYSFPIKMIGNLKIKGFSENHNHAFNYCDTEYFCIVNPDVKLNCDPFPMLINTLNEVDAALVAPLVVNSEGIAEDSVRKFPTAFSIIRKVFSRKRKPDYLINNQIINPDWVAGMFMLFKNIEFSAIGGFDENYFLYYEDVDICKSLHASEKIIVFTPQVSVIHAARRTSHKNLRYLYWHLKSMLIFFLKWRFRKKIV